MPAGLTDAEIHDLVQRVVERTLGAPSPSRRTTEVGGPGESALSAEHREGAVALGADHGGYALKETLKTFVAGLGYRVIDCGTDSPLSQMLSPETFRTETRSRSA